MTSQSQVERPDLDALFADLAHPNPHLQTQAYLAMVDHWPNESMPRLISLLDQPDVSLRRAAVRGLGAFGATDPKMRFLTEVLLRLLASGLSDCNPWRSCLKPVRMARCAPAA